MEGVLKHAPCTPCPPIGHEGMQHTAVTALLFLLSIASFCFHGAKLCPAEAVLFPLHKCSDPNLQMCQLSPYSPISP